MDKKQRIVLIVSAIVSLALVGGALLIVHEKKKLDAAAIVAPHTVSSTELSAGTGVLAKPCLVAVDGFVYQIRGFALWEAGRHLSSNGQAYCGADMTTVINKSPHGRKVLPLLIKVGRLQV